MQIETKKETNPLISIIIPTYNRAHLIRETLDSVKNQIYSNWEVIIVDDHSKDDIQLVVREYLIDSRIKFFQRPKTHPKGAPSCRNFGFQKSEGAYINYLDSDDLLSESKLSSQISSLKGLPELSIACCNWGFFLNYPEEEYEEKNLPYQNKFYNPLEFFEYLGTANTYIPPHCYLVPRQIIEDSGGWREDLLNNQDGEFFVRVILSAAGVRFVADTKVFYRKSTGDNVSAYSSLSKVKSVVKSWKLIEAEFLKKFGDQSFVYVNNSKNRLFQNLLWENPDLVQEFPDFFKKPLRKRKNEMRWGKLGRIIRRAIRKFKKTFSYGV